MDHSDGASMCKMIENLVREYSRISEDLGPWLTDGVIESCTGFTVTSNNYITMLNHRNHNL